MNARRTQIFFSDPDATDSDSGDDASSDGRGKTEIIISHSNSSTKKNPAGCGSRAQAIGSSALAAAASNSKRAVTSASTKRYRGVYERQPGRWAAEFRSHRLKVRQWVGTFTTEEEARAAYDAFEKQFFSSPWCGLPASDRGGNAGDVRKASHDSHLPDEKRQIVLALMASRTLPPAGAMAASVSSVACISSSAMEVPVSSAPWTSSLTSTLAPATPFRKAQTHADAPPSLHSLWADEPADEDLEGLADLAKLSLPFSDANMDFDPADLSLFDNGFL